MTGTPPATSATSDAAGDPNGAVEEVTAGAFPDSTTTGVPPGTALRESGSLTVTHDGAVIDALRVNGVITVEANGVTIRRSHIANGGTYAIRVMPGYSGLLVEDVEIDGRGRGSAIVCCSNFTLRRVDIHGALEGPRLGSNTTVVDSYVHHLRRCSGCHIDALQSTGGANIRVVGNNLQAFNPDTGDPMNAVFQFGSTQGRLRDVLVAGNLMNGGNYTVNGGGGGTTDAAAVFRDNRFGRDFRYAAVGNLGPAVDFDDSNVWHDTGRPVR